MLSDGMHPRLRLSYQLHEEQTTPSLFQALTCLPIGHSSLTLILQAGTLVQDYR
jgi:hypothetical protein